MLKPLCLLLCFVACPCYGGLIDVEDSKEGFFSRLRSSLTVSREVRTTAYTHSEADHKAYGRQTCIGTRLRSGKVTSAAADWSKYPVGTVFKIKGAKGTYVVEDYGSALVGTGTIDIYRPSRKAMNQWGVRIVHLEIVKWGDFKKSAAILKKRTRYRHVRQMLESIRKKHPRVG